MNLKHCFPLWSEHVKQQLAFDSFDIVKKKYPNLNLIILSKEIDVSGKRKYLLSTFEFFFLQYIKMHQHQRCWYEIIRDGYPCKLYFDIEYNKKIHQTVNEQQIMIIFKDFLIKYIQNILKISISLENIMDLDSTTDEKFSRHFIINFKDKIFKNNFECGIFVSKLCNEIIDITKSNTNPLFQNLIIDKTENKKKLFIDQAVYSKNRCFRLPFSSKFKYIKQNKPVYLKPINKYTIKNIKYEQFLDLLVCPINTKNKEFINLNFFSLKPILSNKHKKNYNIKKIHFNVTVKDDKIKKWIYSIIIKNLIDIDRQITIKLYNIYNKYNNIILLYHVNNYRYCENILREHKSNNVYFIINHNKS